MTFRFNDVPIKLYSSSRLSCANFSWFKHMYLLFLTNTLQVSVCIPPDSKLLHPAPLEEGVTEEFYNEFIVYPPPSQQPSHSQQCIEIPSDELRATNRTKDNEVPSLSNINPEEVKTVLHKMATDTMSSYQAQIVQKLKDRETTYAAKLDKIAKSFRS